MALGISMLKSEYSFMLCAALFFNSRCGFQDSVVYFVECQFSRTSDGITIINDHSLWISGNVTACFSNAFAERVEHCGADEFSCQDGNCISYQWRCDGLKDCDNGLDEKNCSKTCANDLFMCKDGQCIAHTWLCDGDNDCLDRSDEESCGEVTCSDGEFKCDDLSRCIDIKWKCDGDFDCPDNSDETYNCSDTDPEEPEICSPATEFKCITSGECIHKSWQCDGDIDCTDSSDEGTNCDYSCREDQFMCENYECISQTLKCDGNDDCINGSDEKECDMAHWISRLRTDNLFIVGAVLSLNGQ